ncbi:MAG: hypothetical protein CBE33_07005 [Candidatus Pelagibacter sp. TMED273]|nr:MAG: hypothetical protein CBE33_07005 [Candidatus Pelagibacter sp. TMED273]|tara:strand:- start:881 stop:1657 length:777 start_codon:yes stop_codon:yes gene_type:complete
MIWNLINLIFRFCGKIYFSNEKKNWLNALEHSKSYEDEIIFNKLKEAYSKIDDINKEFYERDSLILKKKPNEQSLIKFLNKKILATNDREVLDYGGSLGSRFFSNYNFIIDNNINWNIVEQEHLVKYGRKFLKNNFLFFFNDLRECLSKKKINCVIFSGSLQYLDNYIEILEEIKKAKIKYIFLDYLPLSNYARHKIFVQHISKKIYNSSYPIRIFSKKIFFNEAQKLNFSISNLHNKKTVFYGFSYSTLILENLDCS